MSGIIYLEDGTVYTGEPFGHTGTSVGEIIFNTSMTGYEEVIRDKSNSGKIITMTYPLIGNCGVSEKEIEKDGLYTKGLIVKSISDSPSNYKSIDTLESLLKEMKVVGISDVDTRSITKKIRNQGSMKCVITNENLQINELEKLIKDTDIEENWMEKLNVRETYHIEGKGHKLAIMDFGASESIIRFFKEKDFDITVFPYGVSYEEVKELNPEGIIVGNGIGNPKLAINAIDTIKSLVKDKIPMIGIDFGHQIISLALGADTYKMKYGHRGGNHGVYDIEKDTAYIVSQNHGYCVDSDSLNADIIVTHKNLNDETIEGIKHSSFPVYSVQFHPELLPCAKNSEYIIDRFIDLMKEEK